MSTAGRAQPRDSPAQALRGVQVLSRDLNEYFIEMDSDMPTH